MEKRRSYLTVTAVKLGRPPDHAVRLSVPYAGGHLVLQVLLPGEGLARAGVCDGVAELSLFVWPGYVHTHQGNRDGHATATGYRDIKFQIISLNDTHKHTLVESLAPISY